MTKVLDKLETQGSLAFLQDMLFAHIIERFSRQHISNPTCKLASYYALATKLQTVKRTTIFTMKPTDYQYIPNLYLTTLGHESMLLIKDIHFNPLISQPPSFLCFHPMISAVVQKMIAHHLPYRPINNHVQYESLIDQCISDFKVSTTTRDFQSQLRNWNTRFKSGMREYDSFMQKIQETTDRFEVHSLIVQRRLKQNGQPLEFDDVGFTDQLNEEVVMEKAKSITKAVWRNKSKNNVIGVLSKREIDLAGTDTVRLIFFVKKEFSDWEHFHKTALYRDLSTFFIDHHVDRIALGRISSMNAGITPLFQQQELNYYDLNQNYVGDRLKYLKAQLIGSDFWIRVRNKESTIKVERSPNLD